MESKSSTESLGREALTTIKKTETEFGLSLLASTLAHEIRNPLQGIRLQVDAVKRGASVTAAMDGIADGIQRIEAVIAKVQQLSQKYQVHHSRVHLKELITSTLGSLEFWLSAADIKVRTQYRWEGEPIISADSELLAQVLLNLMMNSIQAMPDGGILTVVVSETTDHALIEVMDTGHGIAADVLKVVGTPFFTTKTEGHGLGLSFCKTIVALHGGSLSVESQEGFGTTVTMSLSKEAPGSQSTDTLEVGNA